MFNWYQLWNVPITWSDGIIVLQFPISWVVGLEFWREICSFLFNMSKQAKVYSLAEAIEIIQQCGSDDEGSDRDIEEHDQSSEDELFDDFANQDDAANSW